MKRCSGTGKEALYWLVCDNCENFTEQFDDEWEMLREASEKGWKWMGEKCFCGHACRDEYIRKFVTPGTKLDKRHVWFPQEEGRAE